jgi:hypothetical protein
MRRRAGLFLRRNFRHHDSLVFLVTFSGLTVLLFFALSVAFMMHTNLRALERRTAVPSVDTRYLREHRSHNPGNNRNKRPKNIHYLHRPSFDIQFKLPLSKKDNFVEPNQLGGKEEALADVTDYGNLELYLFEEEGARRQIYKDWHLFETDFRDPDTPPNDDQDAYWAFDDDYIKNAYGVAADHDTPSGRHCRRVPDHMLNFQNCNSFHETPLIEHKAKALG